MLKPIGFGLSSIARVQKAPSCHVPALKRACLIVARTGVARLALRLLTLARESSSDEYGRPSHFCRHHFVKAAFLITSWGRADEFVVDSSLAVPDLSTVLERWQICEQRSSFRVD
jgi:hypothetical protein